MRRELAPQSQGNQHLNSLVGQGKGWTTLAEQNLKSQLGQAASGASPKTSGSPGLPDAKSLYEKVTQHPSFLEYVRRFSKKMELLSRLRPIESSITYTGNILQNYRNATAGGMGALGALYAAANEASMIWVANAGPVAAAGMYAGAAVVGAGLGLGAVAGLEKIQTAIGGDSYSSRFIAAGIRAVAGEPSRSFMESWDDFDKTYLGWLP